MHRNARVMTYFIIVIMKFCHNRDFLQLFLRYFVIVNNKSLHVVNIFNSKPLKRFNCFLRCFLKFPALTNFTL